MTFPAYVHLVKDKIRARFPEVELVGKGRIATFKRGALSLTIDATDAKTWWVTFDRARVYDEQHTATSAAATAESAIAHFS